MSNASVLQLRPTLTCRCRGQNYPQDCVTTCATTAAGVAHDNDSTKEKTPLTHAFATPILSTHEMSSPIPRESGESFASPVPSSPASQYPFPSSEPSRALPQRGSVRRQSTTSSIASIGGVLDTARGGQSTVAESGQNGWHTSYSATDRRH
jgi:hypothetical protein